MPIPRMRRVQFLTNDALNMSALKPENFGAVRLRRFLLPALL